jgi:hypothetical protein
MRQLLIVLILGLAVTACARVTPTEDPAVILASYDQAFAKYNEIKAGMTYEQIVKVMGSPGKQFVQTETQATQHPSVPFPDIWTFDDGGWTTSVDILGGIVSIKSFTWNVDNEMPRVDAVSTTARFNEIKAGMTYDQVKAIMGSSGRHWKSQEMYNVHGNSDWYVWWPDGGDQYMDMMVVSFLNGQVISK